MVVYGYSMVMGIVPEGHRMYSILGHDWSTVDSMVVCIYSTLDRVVSVVSFNIINSIVVYGL